MENEVVKKHVHDEKVDTIDSKKQNLEKKD